MQVEHIWIWMQWVCSNNHNFFMALMFCLATMQHDKCPILLGETETRIVILIVVPCQSTSNSTEWIKHKHSSSDSVSRATLAALWTVRTLRVSGRFMVLPALSLALAATMWRNPPSSPESPLLTTGSTRYGRRIKPLQLACSKCCFLVSFIS